MKHILHATILAGAILVAGVAVAEAPKGSGLQGPTFETLDTDGNGAISQAEMWDRPRARFAEADADGSGGLSIDELRARMDAKADRRATRMLERMDSDGDGQLTFAEMADNPRAARRFERIDKDGDGKLSRAEFDKARERMGKLRGRRGALN